MKVEVAIGEVFDKITILDIKLERISTRIDYLLCKKKKTLWKRH